MAKQYFELLNIHHDKETTWEALGISEERYDFLEKELIYEAHQKKRTKISQSLAYLAKQCESIEELMYISFALGKALNRQCPSFALPLPSHMTGPLGEMIEDLVKRMRGEEGEHPE